LKVVRDKNARIVGITMENEDGSDRESSEAVDSGPSQITGGGSGAGYQPGSFTTVTFTNCTITSAGAGFTSFHTFGAGGGGGGISLQNGFVMIAPEMIAEKPKVEHGGIKVGEIVAWKLWRVIDGTLHSPIVDGIKWPVDGPLEMLKNGGLTDVGDGSSGIYAWKTGKQAREYLYTGVWGRVALWGEIVEHSDGYRAEFARPLSIEGFFKDSVSAQEVKKVIASYGLETASINLKQDNFAVGEPYKPPRWVRVGEKVVKVVLWVAFAVLVTSGFL
jgi:hypothetical protein